MGNVFDKIHIKMAESGSSKVLISVELSAYDKETSTINAQIDQLKALNAQLLGQVHELTQQTHAVNESIMLLSQIVATRRSTIQNRTAQSSNSQVSKQTGAVIADLNHNNRLTHWRSFRNNDGARGAGSDVIWQRTF